MKIQLSPRVPYHELLVPVIFRNKGWIGLLYGLRATYRYNKQSRQTTGAISPSAQ